MLLALLAMVLQACDTKAQELGAEDDQDVEAGFQSEVVE